MIEGATSVVVCEKLWRCFPCAYAGETQRLDNVCLLASFLFVFRYLCRPCTLVFSQLSAFIIIASIIQRFPQDVAAVYYTIFKGNYNRFSLKSLAHKLVLISLVNCQHFNIPVFL